MVKRKFSESNDETPLDRNKVGNDADFVKAIISMDDKIFRGYMPVPEPGSPIHDQHDNDKLVVELKSGPTITAMHLQAFLQLRYPEIRPCGYRKRPNLQSLKNSMRARQFRYLLLKPRSPSGPKKPDGFVRFEVCIKNNELWLLVLDLFLAESTRNDVTAMFVLRQMEQIAKRMRVDTVIFDHVDSSILPTRLLRIMEYSVEDETEGEIVVARKYLDPATADEGESESSSLMQTPSGSNVSSPISSPVNPPKRVRFDLPPDSDARPDSMLIQHGNVQISIRPGTVSVTIQNAYGGIAQQVNVYGLNGRTEPHMSTVTPGFTMSSIV